MKTTDAPTGQLPKRHLEILQHALGVDQYGRGQQYRNHFVGGEEDCRPLVKMGYMREYPASELTGGDPLFRVTDKGKRVVAEQSPIEPKLTRSQQRYRKWLNEDSGLKFGEWLKRKPRQYPYEYLDPLEFWGAAPRP